MSTRVEVLLDDSEHGSFLANMGNRGFTLCYFADADPSEDAIESVRRFASEKEGEFEDIWRAKNRER